MPETVEYVEEENYILVRSFGETCIEDWKGSLEKIRELHSATGNKRVLIDVREQTTAPDTLDIFEFGEGLPMGIRFAIVAAEITKPEQYFLETVGQNRAKSIRLFDNYEEAIEWFKL